MMFLRLLALSVVLFLSVGFGKPEHSEVQAKKITTQNGKEMIEFTVSAKKGYVINPMGPWKIKIKTTKGIVLADKKLELIKDTKDVRTYQKLAKEISKKGKLDFDAVVFVCTDDKKICLREAHKDLTYKW